MIIYSILMFLRFTYVTIVRELSSIIVVSQRTHEGNNLTNSSHRNRLLYKFFERYERERVATLFESNWTFSVVEYFRVQSNPCPKPTIFCAKPSDRSILDTFDELTPIPNRNTTCLILIGQLCR